MSQVLFVSQIDGQYSYRDVDGSVIADSTGIISNVEADVLLERLALGYVELPKDHYAIRLKYSANSEDGEGYRFQFSDLIVTSPTGEPRKVDTLSEHGLVNLLKQEGYDRNKNLRTGCGFIDFDLRVVKWINHPFADDPYTNQIDEISKVALHNPSLPILYKLQQHLNRLNPPHIEPIELNFVNYYGNT